MRTRAVGSLLLVAWFGVLAAALAGLSAVGHGALRAPPVVDGARGLHAWAAARDAPTIAMATVRVGALVLTLYLLASSALATLAHLTRVATVVRWADALTMPGVRRLVGGATGLVLAATPIALRPAPRPGTATGPPPVMVPLAPAPGPARTPVPATRAPATVPRSTVPGSTVPPSTVPPSTVPASTVPGSTVPPPTVPPATVPPATVAAAPARIWTVHAGDSFWSIARSLMTTESGQGPTDAEVAPYWERLIAANVDRLADRDNPSLIYPGQQLVVPPP